MNIDKISVQLDSSLSSWLCGDIEQREGGIRKFLSWDSLISRDGSKPSLGVERNRSVELSSAH